MLRCCLLLLLERVPVDLPVPDEGDVAAFLFGHLRVLIRRDFLFDTVAVPVPVHPAFVLIQVDVEVDTLLPFEESAFDGDKHPFVSFSVLYDGCTFDVGEVDSNLHVHNFVDFKVYKTFLIIIVVS